MRIAISLFLLASLILLAGCLPASGAGRVTVQLTADIRGRDRLSGLEIEMETAGIHSAGHPIAASWVNWPAPSRQVDLLTIRPDETLVLGAAYVPAGRYDRVRIVVEAGYAERTDGAQVPLVLNVEPIALPFELKNDEHIEITMELIALAQADGGYHLFTKSAAISKQ